MPTYAESNLASKPDLVVIGNAISRGNAEAEAALDQKLRYCSLPELLKEMMPELAPRDAVANTVHTPRRSQEARAVNVVSSESSSPRKRGSISRHSCFATR